MNSKQIKYAIALSEVRNYSQVAQKLNITQPALSKQILSLENELGVKLFDRSTMPISITAAGEYFLREAQDLLYKEDQLVKSMGYFQSGDSGQLIIGITPFRSSYLIPPIVKKVRERFPGIIVRLHEANSETLRKETAEGKYDFAIVNLPVNDSVLDIKPLEEDHLALAVPKAYIENPDLQNMSDISFKQCQHFPFIVVGPMQEMRHLFDKLCSSSDFYPNIVAEVVSLTTAWSLAQAGAGATILPLEFIAKQTVSPDLAVFKIADSVYTRQPVVVSKRGQYQSEAAKYAIQLLTDAPNYDKFE